MQPAFKAYRSLLLQVFSLSLLAEFLIVFHEDFSFELAALDATITALSLTLCVWVTAVSVCKYPTKVGIIGYSFLVGAVFGAACWYLDKFTLHAIYHDARYLAFLKRTQWQWLAFFGIISSWIATNMALKRKTVVLEEQFKELTDAATLHREAELFKLRQQLQPHFLYNSLNSISALIMIEPEHAQEMIGKLSDFLRSSVKREGKELLPIAEELEYIEAYLAIEAVRFGDRLEIAYDKNFTDHAQIPPFLLQPILENAIKFGLYGNSGRVRIQVQIALAEGMLNIRITNPYDPINRPPRGTGFGLEGIRRRLYLLFGRTDLLHTSIDIDTFTTTLNIPQYAAEGNSN